MRCSPRSTTCRGKRLIRALGAALTCAVAAAPGVSAVSSASDTERRVRSAITNAIQELMGPAAHVELENLAVECVPTVENAPIVAVPEPGRRTGSAVRFVLYGRPADEPDDGHVRIGRADAIVSVEAPHVRVASPIRAGDTISADAVLAVVDDVGRVPIEPLPTLDAVSGARARRALEPGEVLTAVTVRIPPLVQSRDDVSVLVSLGQVQVRGHARALQSGGLGDEILLVNPENNRRLTGIVIGPGQVEVLHER